MIEMSTLEMFYLVYRHSKQLHDKLSNFLNTSPDFNAELDFHQRLERLARFAIRISKNPPVKEHVELLKKVHGTIVSKDLRSSTVVGRTISTLKDALFEYLKTIAPIAIAVTETEDTFKRYFRVAFSS
jgi:hypothetical protein